MSSGPAPITIGVIGLGPAGLALLSHVDAHPAYRLAAVCDTRPAALEAFRLRSTVQCFGTPEELMALDALEVVLIATPTSSHAALAIRALAGGKHVIVEKPMALTLEEASAMVTSAREHRRHLLVGHSQSFEPAIQLMRGVIAGGRFGALRAVNALNYTDWMYRPRRPDELERAAGGGVVWRQGSHHADLVRYITGGDPLSVRAQVQDWRADRRGDGSYTAWLSFPEGLVASLFYSGYDHFRGTDLTYGINESGRQVQQEYAHARKLLQHDGGVAGSAKAKHSDAALRSQMARLAGGSLPAHFGLLIASCEGADLRVGREGLEIYADDRITVVPIEGLPAGRTALLDEMAAALQQGTEPVHDGAWGWANLALCGAIIASSDTGAEVRCAPSPWSTASATLVRPPAAIQARLHALGL